MENLTLADFSESVGADFSVEAGGSRYALKLEEAQELPASGRSGGSFRLQFRGPSEPILPQAIYSFRRGESCHEIFIVPIGQEAEGVRYEAVFF